MDPEVLASAGEGALTQLGVGGIFVILVLRLVLDFLKSREVADAKKSGCAFDADFQRRIKELYDWHALTDSDGVKVWYVRKSLDDAVLKLSESVESQTEILRELMRLQNETNTELVRLRERG